MEKFNLCNTFSFINSKYREAKIKSYKHCFRSQTAAALVLNLQLQLWMNIRHKREMRGEVKRSMLLHIGMAWNAWRNIKENSQLNRQLPNRLFEALDERMKEGREQCSSGWNNWNVDEAHANKSLAINWKYFGINCVRFSTN